MGCTLRRLAANVASYRVMEEIGVLPATRQLGFGVRMVAEAAVHASRRFLNNLKPIDAIVKLDFSNAFNSIRRDKMLKAVQELM